MLLGAFLKFLVENLESGVVAFVTPGPDGRWSLVDGAHRVPAGAMVGRPRRFAGAQKCSSLKKLTGESPQGQLMRPKLGDMFAKGWSGSWKSGMPFLADQPKAINDTIAFVRPYTMTSAERIAALCQAVVHVERWQIPGDIVECGVWKGGSMMAAAITLRESSTSRSLYLYDTFDGMPPPSHLDNEASSGRTAQEVLDSSEKDSYFWAISPLEEVKNNMERVGYPSQHIHYVKGKVEDTIPANVPNAIALLRLDTDWYESTKHELKHLWPLLSPNGILIIDDYGFWTGARKAVDEFFDTIPSFLHRIDDTGRLVVKLRV